MHELGITQSIVDACSARAGASRVARVTVEIGALCAIVPDAMLFCYDVCAQGTPLEGSRLEILSIPGHARCNECGSEVVLADWLAACACGSVNLERSGGDELRIKEMEIL